MLIRVRKKYLNILSILFKTILLTSILFTTACSQQQGYEQADNTYGSQDLHQSAKYNVQLGLGYLEQGDVERAKEKFLKAVKQSPRMPQAHYNLAHFYYLIDELKQADKHFNKAISYSYGNTKGILGTAHNNYGVFLCQTKRYQEAYHQFEQAIDDFNYADSSSAYENSGLCALKDNNKQLAKDYFNKAIKHNPLSPKALIVLNIQS